MSADGLLGIIALVPEDWNHIVTTRHHVVHRLARYCPVVWLEPPRSWREFLSPSEPRFLAKDGWSEPTPSLEVLSPGCRHPEFLRPDWLRRASFRSRLSTARQRLLERGATRIALYLWRDEFAEALDLVPHDFSCYHVDDEYTFSDKDLPTSPREADVLRRVDQVIVHSMALYEKKGRINPNTALIPNGVDYRLFSSPQQEPGDLASIVHPRIGYAGAIKRHMDFELLIRLATLRPDWSFVMVGPVTSIHGKEDQVAALRGLPNVHFLGGKPANSLPAYMQHFDVCLMCYAVNGYTRYIYPLKLHEYLASGRPAVSSPIGSVQEHAQVVAIARSHDEWLAAIEQALGENATSAAAVALRQATARSFDWDILVERVARLFTLPGPAHVGSEPSFGQEMRIGASS